MANAFFRMGPWFHRKIVDPLLQILRRGAEPKQLAFSAALGISLGVFPICVVWYGTFIFNTKDKNLSKITGFSENNLRFDERTTESQATLTNQGAITQLSEHVSTLNDRMDKFTSQIEELNSKLTNKRGSASPQKMPLQAEACNGSAPTSYFISSLGNGSLTGPIMPNSSSSSQLAKESPLMEEYGVSPKRFGAYKELYSFFKVLTTSVDSDNKVYVSTVHAHNYPITAFQWHLEEISALRWNRSGEKIP